MTLYRFTPRPEGLSSPHWKASSYQGPCHVNADSEREAIRFVNGEFGTATSKNFPHEEIPVNPWGNPDLTDITVMAHMTGPEPPKGVVMIPVENKKAS